jgi:CO/xanthine dehydrogenase Mo-binding subunit
MSENQVQKGNNSDQLSRRDFLRMAGCGLFIFFVPEALEATSLPQPGRAYPSDLNAYLKIGTDGRVSLFCSKIEMGQGIITSMKQMLAEELDVALDSIDIVMGDTMLCPWDGGTVGSRSTKYYGPPLRRAGAEARAIMMQMAAEKLNSSTEQLVVRNGVVSHSKNATLKVTYAELIQGKQIDRHLSDVQIKPVSGHIISGKALLRTDALEKVTGSAKFTGDIRPPGMLYAKVLRPPSHDAVLVSSDASKAGKVKGAIVVQEDDLIAVLHENPEQAEYALSLITAMWNASEPKADNQSIFGYLKKAAPEGRVYTEEGNLETGRETAVKNLESEFYCHYVAHAPIEPYTVLADVKPEKVTIHASTQAPFQVRATAAEALGLPEEKVHVITPFVGGGFGGKKSGRQVREAVKLAKITGRPVLLAWSRKEEFFYDAFRPAAVLTLASGLDEEGHITFWECDILFAGSRSSEPIYNIHHFRIRTADGNRVHPFATGAWRGPGSNSNVFAMESHTDILAQAAGLDPLEFRMKNLTDPRMIRVLKAAAEKSGHDFKKKSAGRGFGISCTNYLNTYVATIAEVTVNKSSGKVKVERVVCAQDMGEIINPQGAKLQIEGGITMGLSAALTEEIIFKGGKIDTENFGTYRITRFSDAPKVDVVLIDNPDLPPQGCGEPAITTVGAALANAIFDATGARVFTLPMTPERIKAAMG